MHSVQGVIDFLQRHIDLNYIIRNLPVFAEGLELTIYVSAVALAISLVWGLALVVPIMARKLWIRAPFRAYIEFTRNTPLLLQLFVIYFGFPQIGITWSAFACGSLAVGLQHGAFLSDTFRGGIQSVSKFQHVAAKGLGMTEFTILRLVILPQALLKVLPSVGNQVALLIKDTSLVSAIGVLELTLTGKRLSEKSAATFEVFVVVALMFLILTTIAGVATRFLESRYRARL